MTDESLPLTRRVAIVGCGLIGGSIDLAVRQHLRGTDVIALDRGDDLDRAVSADLIVLAAPVGEIIALLGALRPLVSASTLITDTGSTKAAIVAAAEGLRFIGGHPVAGAAVSGRGAARADLFAGRPWVITPTAAARPDDVERLQDFIRALGARPKVLDAAAHDRLFAFISHLPQLVASALLDVAGTAAGADGLALAGSGLRDTTRLAGSPPEIWREIVRTNDGNIASALEALVAVLTDLRSGNADALSATFERAREWRRVLETEAAERAERETRGDTEHT